MLEDVMAFYENYDFDMVLDWLMNTDLVPVVSQPVIAGPLVLVVVMLLIPKTSAIAQGIIVYVPVAGFFFVSATVLHNDEITNVGPFILALSCFFIVVGWFIYTKMLKS